MCESTDGCADGLVCAELLDTGGFFPANFCSECETNAECDEGQTCTPTYDFGPSAAAAATVAQAVLKHGLPPLGFSNINVPSGTPNANSSQSPPRAAKRRSSMTGSALTGVTTAIFFCTIL